MCEAPLFRKRATVSGVSSLLSPVRRAFKRGTVSPEGKGSEPMRERSACTAPSAHLSTRPMVPAAGRAAHRAQNMPARRKVRRTVLTETDSLARKSCSRKRMGRARTGRIRAGKSAPVPGNSTVPVTTPAVKHRERASMLLTLSLICAKLVIISYLCMDILKTINCTNINL